MTKAVPDIAAEEGRPWWSIKYMAYRYNVSEVSIWRWAKSNKIPKPHNIGPGVVRFSRDQVLEDERRRLEGAA